jgi:hypothetical protein
VAVRAVQSEQRVRMQRPKAPLTTARATGEMLYRVIRLIVTAVRWLLRWLLSALGASASLDTCTAPRVLALVITDAADATAGLSRLAENLVWWGPLPSRRSQALGFSRRGASWASCGLLAHPADSSRANLAATLGCVRAGSSPNPNCVAPVGLVGVAAGASVDSTGLLPPQ